jgi:hypothetical protein
MMVDFGALALPLQIPKIMCFSATQREVLVPFWNGGLRSVGVGVGFRPQKGVMGVVLDGVSAICGG